MKTGRGAPDTLEEKQRSAPLADPPGAVRCSMVCDTELTPRTDGKSTAVTWHDRSRGSVSSQRRMVLWSTPPVPKIKSSRGCRMDPPTSSGFSKGKGMTRVQAYLSGMLSSIRNLLTTFSLVAAGEREESLLRGEPDLSVFISSVMNDELDRARELTVRVVESLDYGRSWAFEFTPASSETTEDGYLRKVKDADFVIWLVGSITTEPVAKEVNECIAAEGRLLVFKLPSEPRDCATTELLNQVGSFVKWQEVEEVAQLAQHISLAIADEVVRALRDPTPPFRSKRLRELRQLSVSSCKTAWMAIGVSEDLANDLASDSSVGNVLDFPGTGINMVDGDQGAGKSLAVHRLYQLAIDKAIAESSEPYPLFLNARDLQGSLSAQIGRECRGFADPFVQGVFLVVDGIDEMGVREANLLLDDIKAFCAVNPRTTAVVTSRLVAGLNLTEERNTVPALSEEESVALINKIAGQDLDPNDLRAWPDSMREVAKYPLFAVMIGVKMRDDSDYAFSSRNKLVEELARDALEDAEGYSGELDRLLHKLATISISTGSRVRLVALDRVRANQRLVTESRIVTESAGTVDFALPVFREWYAARAILEGSTEVEEIQLASDRWLIPLSIVLNSGDEQIIQSLMLHLSSSDPGLASLLLGMHDRELPGSRHEVQDLVPSLKTEFEAGVKIKETIEAWKLGLGDLYYYIAPVKTDGGIKALGVDIGGLFVTTHWYEERDIASSQTIFTRVC